MDHFYCIVESRFELVGLLLGLQFVRNFDKFSDIPVKIFRFFKRNNEPEALVNEFVRIYILS